MAPTDDDYFLRWKDVVGTRNWVRKSKLLDQKVQAKIVWYRWPSWWNEHVLLVATSVLDRAGLDLDKRPHSVRERTDWGDYQSDLEGLLNL